MPFQMRTWFSQPSNFSGANVMHFYWAKTVAQVLLRAKKMPVLSIALSSLTIMWTWWFGASVAFSANDPRRLCLCVFLYNFIQISCSWCIPFRWRHPHYIMWLWVRIGDSKNGLLEASPQGRNGRNGRNTVPKKSGIVTPSVDAPRNLV